MMKNTIVPEYPKCDICGAEAHYDCKTRGGPWAYLCDDCHAKRGTQIGTKLIKCVQPITPEELPKDACCACGKKLKELEQCFAIYGLLYCDEECARLLGSDGIEAGEYISTEDIGVR